MSEAQNGGNVMERLTQRLRTGEVLMASEYEEKYTEQEWISVLQDRLAAYEETGRTPEEVTALGKLFDYALEESKTLTEQLALLNRIRDLAEADRDGRVAALPCKVGDTVYLLFAGNPNNPVISTLKINTVAEAVKLIGKMGMHKYIGTFRTREEAKRALEAMKDE